MSGKYSQKIFWSCHQCKHAKQSAKHPLKRAIQKQAKASGDLTCNKISNRMTKVLKKSRQNNSETVTNENDKKIPKERYMSPEKIQKINDDLRLT